MKAEILKIAKVKNEKEFYAKYPTEDAFMKVHKKAFKKAKLGSQLMGKLGTKAIEDDRGQHAHPGKITKIDSNRITMKGVPYPVLGISDKEDIKVMYPDNEYKFLGNNVLEFPILEYGGELIGVDDKDKDKKNKKGTTSTYAPPKTSQQAYNKYTDTSKKYNSPEPLADYATQLQSWTRGQEGMDQDLLAEFNNNPMLETVRYGQHKYTPEQGDGAGEEQKLIFMRDPTFYPPNIGKPTSLKAGKPKYVPQGFRYDINKPAKGSITNLRKAQFGDGVYGSSPDELQAMWDNTDYFDNIKKGNPKEKKE